MIDMRMACDHLSGKSITDISHIELFLLLGNLGIETDVQQDVAQFLTDIMDIVLDQRIAELVGLFYRIWSEALVGLLPVPGAIRPQCVEHIKKTPESLHFFFFRVHNSSNIGAKIQNN